ncbi:MAG: hypothetical protein E7092_07805 [Bacteroidales bacterium]|nr:hypothetical protein [Bacteroidales bacterium]
MKITKYLIGSLICLTVLAACGPSGKNRKREPSRQSKKEVVEEKKKETPSEEEVNIEEERNNGNFKAPSTRKKGNSRLRRKGNGKPVPVPEEETIRDGSLNMARIEERVRLEQKIWEASTKENTEQFNKLKEQAAELAKKMTIQELDEAYKRIKNLKKMQ